MERPSNISYSLPITDKQGFCNILFSGLGGDGANMAAKLLFKIGCQEFGLDGGYDARYGSEKKGTPTDASVRLCRSGVRVRQSGPTDRPHFLVVFHQDLIEPLELHRGLQPGAVCVVNTIHTPESVRDRLKLPHGRVVCVDATRIAARTRSRLNMPLLAVLCHAMGLPDEVIAADIARQWPHAKEANLGAYREALKTSVESTFTTRDDFNYVPPSVTRGPIGYRNMLNGGTIDALTHNTSGRDNRVAGRGRIPRFHPESCNSCGICLTVCSDPGGLLWREGRMAGIDPLFCKGCMRCVEVCPQSRKGGGLTVVMNGEQVS